MEVAPKNSNKGISIDDTILFMERFTKTYQQFQHDHPAVREVMCLREQYPFILCDILDDDLFAGRLEWPALSFTPQADGNEGGFGYVLNFEKFDTLYNSPGLNGLQKNNLNKIKEFWITEHTSFKTRQSYSPELKKGLPSDNWTRESGIAFPLYRMSGTQLDYKKLVKLGIHGLIEEVKLRKAETKTNPEFYDASVMALELFRDICLYYKRKALEKSKEFNDEIKRNQFKEIAATLENIASQKPSTLREAIQLSFLYCVVSGSQNYGRIDDFLGDFLVRDLKNGTLTRDSARLLFEGYWKIMIARMSPYDGRVIIGGKGRENEETADPLALLAIETAGHVIDILPQLTLRFYKGQNPDLYNAALETLSKGSTFPMLYNDEANIPAVQKAFDVPYEEAIDYTPFGCGEYILNHKSVGTPSSVLNLLKCLEVTLHKGIDPLTGKNMGIDLNNVDYSSFDKLWNAYSKNIEYFIDLLAIQEELEYKIAGTETACLYFSILYDDCLKRGKTIFDGGVRYLGGTLETYGNINTSDSLFAIKQMVFEKKEIPLENLVKEINQNFKDNEGLRQQLLKLPKYGNDIAEVDLMAMKVHQHVCNYTRDQRKKTNLHNFLVVNINNDANTTLGKYTGASADGRKAFTSMSNGNTPMMGMDRNGITALLNSLVKLDIDIHAGATQNMKFSKEMLSKYREQLNALLQTYFDNGGAQVMLTVTGKNDLQNALAEPQKYHHIIVRVGGFSARFVELSHEVQNEILLRTLY